MKVALKKLNRRFLGISPSAARCLAVAALSLAAPLTWLSAPAAAQEADPPWIWSPEHAPNQAPQQATCHFRKKFTVQRPERVAVAISSDDEYQLHINGRRVADGPASSEYKHVDVSRWVRPGENLLAIEVTNSKGSTAGLSARIYIKEPGRDWVGVPTDASWRTSLRPLPFWTANFYNDGRWAPAREVGSSDIAKMPAPDVDVAAPERRLASRDPQAATTTTTTTAAPARTAATSTAASGAASPAATKAATPNAAAASEPGMERFTIPSEFTITQVAEPDQTGSLIAMAFNEFGHIVASREGGPLLLIYDGDGDGKFEKVRTYCDRVTNCQGILCLNGDVYVTADGPDGAALYRLYDAAPGEKPDGNLDHVETILRFNGSLSEHGPHGLALGVDGMIYIVAGNHTEFTREFADSSPHRDYYEGDLVQPRYEDPGGHAVGRKAPGGVVLRTDVTGSKVELVAGGLRNAYDLVFNREGELFVHDSDMEADIGTAWEYPTRLYHVTAGAEFGWRSGWAKWPDYFIDCLPAVADTGRGSPTGAVCYNHHMFPARYHNALFLGDWSEGRILAVRLTRQGATYKADTETFVQGQPLNVTDLDVGPDGSLYFCTGGRGTEGGVFRVSWKGQIPAEIRDIGEGVTAQIRHPQLQSAWGRQKIAAERNKLIREWKASAQATENGRALSDAEALDAARRRWGGVMGRVALSAKNPASYRARALHLMHLFGAEMDAELLTKLSKVEDAEVRAKAAEMMGLAETPGVSDRLAAMLSDESALVRRAACEAITRRGETVAFASLQKMLASADRHEAWAARRMLERIDPARWQEDALASDNQPVFLQSATALLIAHPSRQSAEAVMERIMQLLSDRETFISDGAFLDMMRILQIALLRGGLAPSDAPDVRTQIAHEYPAADPLMNRELVRLLAYLQADSALDRLLKQLRSDNLAQADKLHVAFHLRYMASGWTAEKKFQLLEFFDEAERFEGGGSLAGYVRNVARDFSRSLSDDEARQVLAQGTRWPNAALGALYALPKELDDDLFATLAKLDKDLEDHHGVSVDRLKVGLTAVLARDASERSLALLRDIWERDPNRREAVALGLSQAPEGENWHDLVRSLPALQAGAGREVLARLRSVNQGPDGAEHYRQVILLGLKLEEQGAEEAVKLLEFWTGERRHGEGDSWSDALAAWQDWFAQTYPDMPPAERPREAEEGKWKFDELLAKLNGPEAAEASTTRGAEVFQKAQCAKCHRFGGQGESLGPDLTAVAKRFTKAELLESILFPSHTISDQYASKTVVTTGGRTFTGLVGAGASGELTVLQSDGRKVAVKEDEVDEILPSRKSSMPEGLLDNLELAEIQDLFAYLTRSAGSSSGAPSTGKAAPKVTRRPIVSEAN